MGMVCNDDFHRSRIYNCLLLVIHINARAKQKGNRMSLLNNEQINEELNNMDGWVYKDNKI